MSIQKRKADIILVSSSFEIYHATHSFAILLMHQLLLQNIANKGLALNAEEAGVLQSLFHPKQYRKHQYLLQQGEISRYEIFVNKGMVRSYLIDDKGQEHVMKFSPEDWWAGDLYSFVTGKPSSYSIDCLEDTEILRISQPDMDRLIESVPTIGHYFRILYRNSVVAYNQRVAASLTSTALERYQAFRDKYPHIEQRVPNHQIASYLGITPQSLSRLRKQAVVRKLP